MGKNIKKLIDQIQAMRARNNKNWMDFVRLAYKVDKQKAGKIMARITENDRKINLLNKKMVEK